MRLSQEPKVAGALIRATGVTGSSGCRIEMGTVGLRRVIDGVWSMNDSLPRTISKCLLTDVCAFLSLGHRHTGPVPRS